MSMSICCSKYLVTYSVLYYCNFCCSFSSILYHILSLSLNCRYFSVYLYMPVALVSTQPKCLFVM